MIRQLNEGNGLTQPEKQLMYLEIANSKRKKPNQASFRNEGSFLKMRSALWIPLRTSPADAGDEEL